MLTPGTILQDRFEIVREIGRGGMGAVFEGRDLKFNGSPIAIKQCLLTSDQMKQAFFKEASLLARLDHPYLPDAREHFVEGDGHFLIMKYIEGDDLENLLLKRGHPFEVEEVKGWMDQVLDALVYMHGLTPLVIHRDIKPGNIKLTPTGHVKLIDFGLAKGGGGTSIAGYSLNYSAPEQLQETGSDARTDLYSLGATMYRLLSGQIPKSAFERTNSLLNDQPDPLMPLHRLNSRVSEAVSQVVAQALALRKNDRYATAADLKRALRAAAENKLPVVVPAYTPTQLPDAGFSRTVTPDIVSEPAPYSPTEIKGEASAKPAGFSVTQTPEESANPPAISRTVTNAEESKPAIQVAVTPTVQPDKSPLPVKEQASKSGMMGKLIAAATGGAVLIGGIAFWSLKPRPIDNNTQSTASPTVSASASPGNTTSASPSSIAKDVGGKKLTYQGDIGGIPIEMTLQVNGTALTGTYFYVKYKKTLEARGEIKAGKKVEIKGYDQGKIVDIFVGEMISEAEIKGDWIKPDVEGESRPFTLKIQAKKSNSVPAAVSTATPKPKPAKDESQSLIDQMNEAQKVMDAMKKKKQ